MRIYHKQKVFLKFIALTSISAVLPGELPAKAVAKIFWREEVEDELSELGIREQWTPTNQKNMTEKKWYI